MKLVREDLRGNYDFFPRSERSWQQMRELVVRYPAMQIGEKVLHISEMPDAWLHCRIKKVDDAYVADYQCDVFRLRSLIYRGGALERRVAQEDLKIILGRDMRCHVLARDYALAMLLTEGIHRRLLIAKPWIAAMQWSMSPGNKLTSDQLKQLVDYEARNAIRELFDEIRNLATLAEKQRSSIH